MRCENSSKLATAVLLMHSQTMMSVKKWLYSQDLSNRFEMINVKISRYDFRLIDW